MFARALVLRPVALVTLAALAVHQLRMTVEGSDAGGAADSAIHRSLPVLASVAVVLLALAAAQFAAQAVRASRSSRGADRDLARARPLSFVAASSAGASPRGFATRCARAAAVVFAAHLVQQLAEGVAAGHPLAGLGVVGLLVAAACAAMAGAVVAATVGGADRALAALRGVRRARRARPGRSRWTRRSPLHVVASRPLTRHLAGRAPPATA